MKYIIETEMPLTEVYVRVSQEEFSRLRLNTNVSKKDWVHSSSGWLKPLPVSPMKEVEKEWNKWMDETTKNAEAYVKEFWYEQDEHIQRKLILSYRAGALKQLKEVQP